MKNQLRLGSDALVRIGFLAVVVDAELRQLP
jgi:hypothetical protein